MLNNILTLKKTNTNKLNPINTDDSIKDNPIIEQELLYCNKFKLTDKIIIHIPTLEEIFQYGEENYFKLISQLLSTSKDYMVQLDDIGIDYEEISDFDLFSQITFQTFKDINTDILFCNINLSDFELGVNSNNNEIILYNLKEDIIIDRYIYALICNKFREILHMDKDLTKPANKEAKAFIIERTRKKQQRASKKTYNPILRPLILSLVNSPEYKYNFNESLDLNIYTFYSSVKAIQKRINYNQIMSGIYAGTVSAKDINMNEINWLG